MKHIATLLVVSFALVNLAGAEIVIKPIRTPSVSTNKPGIVVPGPDGGTIAIQKPQVIELLNGDQLQGTFVAFDHDTGAKWRHPAAKTDIEFSADAVSRISLYPRPPQIPNRQNCRVTLRTGEELIGEVIELDDEYLTLGAWYARGSLRIPKERVLSIAPGGKANSVMYEGPRNADGWVGVRAGNVNFNAAPRAQQVPQQQLQVLGGLRANGPVPGGGRAGWSFNKDSFVSVGSGSQIGRKIKFADRTNIEFDLGWRGSSFNLGVYVASDKLAQSGANSYIVGVSNYNCYLTRSSSRSNSTLGNQSVSAQVRGKMKLRVSIRFDRKNSRVTLLLDNKVIREWTDSSGFAGKGDYLMFVAHSATMMKISNIQVTEWDGTLPKPGEADSGKRDTDLIRGGDSDLSGNLVGIANGKARFKTSFTELNMPLEDVNFIRLAGELKPEKPKLGIGDVRVTLANGGEFIFQLEKWTADRVTGNSPVFGRVDFRPGAFDSVEFNLTKQRESSGDDEFDF